MRLSVKQHDIPNTHTYKHMQPTISDTTRVFYLLHLISRRPLEGLLLTVQSREGPKETHCSCLIQRPTSIPLGSDSPPVGFQFFQSQLRQKHSSVTVCGPYLKTFNGNGLGLICCFHFPLQLADVFIHWTLSLTKCPCITNVK